MAIAAASAAGSGCWMSPMESASGLQAAGAWPSSVDEALRWLERTAQLRRRVFALQQHFKRVLCSNTSRTSAETVCAAHVRRLKD